MAFLSKVCFIIIIILAQLALAQLSDFESTNFNKADSIAALYPKHSLSNLRELALKLSEPLPTEQEKFRAIYKWVCENIRGDYNLFQKTKYKRAKLRDHPEKLKQWNKKANELLFDHLINAHKTVCTGYAYLIKRLANYAGLRCEMIDGYARTIDANVGGEGILNHTWNVVQINGKWYLCDATWSSGSFGSFGQFFKAFEPCYFLMDPKLFVRNHYPLDTKWLLLKNGPILEAYLNGPLAYKSALKNKILPVTPDEFIISATPGVKIPFQFKVESVQNQKQLVRLYLYKEGQLISANFPEVSRVNYNIYFDYSFILTGSYDLHVLVNNEYQYTYHVEVNRTITASQ